MFSSSATLRSSIYPMNERLETLVGKMRVLEQELAEEAKRKESEFCYTVHQKAVEFTDEAKVRHRKLRLGIRHYLTPSRFLVIATSPVIWMCAAPIALADL